MRLFKNIPPWLDPEHSILGLSFWITIILMAIYYIPRQCSPSPYDRPRERLSAPSAQEPSFNRSSMPDTVPVIEHGYQNGIGEYPAADEDTHDPYDREYWEGIYPWLDWETAIEQYENGPYEDFEIFIEEEYDMSNE